MIDDNENETGMKNISHRYNINRPRPRHEHKYIKYKMWRVMFRIYNGLIEKLMNCVGSCIDNYSG